MNAFINLGEVQEYTGATSWAFFFVKTSEFDGDDDPEAKDSRQDVRWNPLITSQRCVQEMCLWPTVD